MLMECVFVKEGGYVVILKVYMLYCECVQVI